MSATDGGPWNQARARRALASIPASYTIFKDGTTYYAEATKPGGTDYSGADLYTVINSALGALTTPRTWFEKIRLKGDLGTLATAIILDDYTAVTGGKISLPINATHPIFDTDAALNHIILANMYLLGNQDNGATSNIIDFKDHAVDNLYMSKVYATDAGQDCLSLYGEAGTIRQCTFNYAARYGVRIASGGNYKFYGGYIGNNSEYGLVVTSSTYNGFYGVEIATNTYDGAYCVTDHHNTFFDCHFYDNTLRGMLLDRSQYNKVLASHFTDNSSGGGGYTGLGATGTCDGCQIIANHGYDTRVPKKQASFLELADAVTNFIVTDNDARGNLTTTMTLGAGAGHIVRGNLGFVTENKGTGTIANGATNSGNIAHGLSYTPVAGDFWITGKEDPTNSVGTIWVAGIDATNFVVYVENDPGASGWDFGWSVRRN